MSSNDKVEKYLDHYIGLQHESGYAVMIEGAWGVGKTSFIKSYIKKKGEEGFLYVSLYGMSSYTDIENEFFTLIHPTLSSKKFTIAAKIFKGAVNAGLRIDLDGDGKQDASVGVKVPDVDFSSYLRETGDCVLVFDDLERCSIPVENVLGYINYFVEHKDMKCILLANEDELSSGDYGGNERYRIIKEKLIGQTLQVTSDVKAVLRRFVNDVSGNVSDYINENIKEIEDAYLESRICNLRLLKYSVWDCENILGGVDAKYLENSKFIKSIISFIVPFSLEFRSGNITENDFEQLSLARVLYYTGGKDKPEMTRIKEIMDKYNAVDLGSPLLGHNFWFEYFSQGIVSDSIDTLVSQCHFFSRGRDEDWLKMLHFMELSDVELLGLVVTCEKKIENCLYSSLGELLHIVGVFLWLADKNIYSGDIDSLILNAGKAAGKIIRSEEVVNSICDVSSYGGYAYWSIGNEKFLNYFNTLKKIEREYSDEKMPGYAEELLVFMVEDISRYGGLLAQNSSSFGESYKKPFLTLVDVDDFMGAYFKVDYYDRRSIFTYLASRFKDSYVNRELIGEKQWLESLRDEMLKKSAELSESVSGYILSMSAENYINPAINNLEEVMN